MHRLYELLIGQALCFEGVWFSVLREPRLIGAMEAPCRQGGLVDNETDVIDEHIFLAHLGKRKPGTEPDRMGTGN